jgi:hypothetical protein
MNTSEQKATELNTLQLNATKALAFDVCVIAFRLACHFTEAEFMEKVLKVLRG